MSHTAIERAIKSDIIRKNTLLKKIRRMERRAARWNREAPEIGHRRKKKKYLATATRFIDEVSRLKPEVLEMVKDLDARIHEEMEFSVGEVKSFKEQLSREKTEMEKIAEKLEQVEEKLHADEEEYTGTLKEEKGDKETGKLKEQVEKDKAEEAKLKSLQRKEAKRVAGLERELASEETDRKIFTEEMEHIEAEKEILKEHSPDDSERK